MWFQDKDDMPDMPYPWNQHPFQNGDWNKDTSEIAGSEDLDQQPGGSDWTGCYCKNKGN